MEALVCDLWESEVEPRVPLDVDVQAWRRGALQGKRGLGSAAQMLRSLLAYALCAPSFRRLGAWVVLIGLADQSESARRKALRRASYWMAWLLGELLVVPGPSEWLAGRVRGRVLAIDGTHLRQVGGSGDDWRLLSAYDLLAGRLSQVQVSDAHTAEGLAHYQLQAGDVVVADNGYGYRSSVTAVVQQQAEGVFRITPSTFPLQDEDGEAIEVQAWLRQAGEVVRSLACWWLFQGQAYAVRLIALQLHPEEAAAARERKIKKARKQGRTPLEATLFYAGWVLLITTLPQAGWSAADVLRLYRARWQMEIVQSQMTKTYVLASGGGGDHVADLHLLFTHHNAINEQFNHLPFLLEGRLSQSLLHALTKCFNGLNHRSEVIMLSHAGFELTNLPCDRLKPLLQFVSPPPELLELDHLGQIGFRESF